MSRHVLRIHPDGSRSWLHEPAGAGRGRDAAGLTVIVPAEPVLLLRTARLPLGPARLAQALAYAVEDQVAVPIETQHVAWAPLPDPGQVLVAVVARSRMRGWLDSLAADGLSPERMVPDSLLVPVEADRPVLLVEGARGLLRLDEARAFCGDVEEAMAVAAADGRTPRMLRVGDASAPPSDGEPRRVARAIDVFAGQLDAPQAIVLNLLQGEFRPRGERAAQGRAWRAVAGLAVAATVLAFGHLAIERRQLAAEVEAQRAEMASLYRSLVPGSDVVASPEAYLRSALQAAGQAEPPVLELLGSLAKALAGQPLELDALEYRNRVLEAVVAAPDVAALDALRAGVVATGTTAELAAATPGSRGVEGRLVLRGSPP